MFKDNECNYISYIKDGDSIDDVKGCALYKNKCSASFTSGACKPISYLA